MLKVIFSVLLFITSTASCFSQEKKEEIPKLAAKNAVYVELLGTAFFYSINYDRIFIKGKKLALSGRGGISYFPRIKTLNTHRLGFPLELNLLIGKQNKYFEFGVAGTYQLYLDEPGFPKSFFTSLRIGFRHQNVKKGRIFRVALTPILPIVLDDEYQFDTDVVIGIPWLGVSIGKTF